MRNKNLLICLALLISFMFASCHTYQSYEQIVKQRNRIKPINFEKEKWFDDEGIGKEALWEKRPNLARDLVNRKLLIGKNFEEITELLGEVEKTDGENIIKYEIFYESGVADPIFIENLVVVFDKQNITEEAKIEIVMMDGHPDYR